MSTHVGMWILANLCGIMEGMTTDKDLEQAVTRYTEITEQAKQERDETIRRAHEEGWKQSEIVKATGMTRETIRRITNPDAAAAVLKAAADRRAAKKKET